MNFIDKIVSYFSPRAGAERQKFRYISGLFADKTRRYEAAGRGRRTEGWKATGTDANVELGRDGRTLRDRAREMGRNNPYTRRAFKVIPSNVTGGGIRLSLKGATQRKTDAVKKLWKEWAEKTVCDFDERKTFYAIQRLVMRAVVESGEVFVRQVRDVSLAIPLQLQLLEADYLDRSKDGVQLSGGNYIEQGIEFNERGKRVAYWMFSQHPGGNRVWKSLESVRIPAAEILHIFQEERPGQIVGAPTGAASMLRLRDFDEYEDAQLLRQKVAACFAAFVTQAEEPAPSDVAGSKLPIEKLEPGLIEYLTPGKEVVFGNPPPVENYDEYARTTLRGVAAGYDVTYEALTGDLSNVNFSSGRMGWIEFGRFVQEWQNEVMIPQLCDKVWGWFYDACVIKGLIRAGDDFQTEWTAPRRELIDPAKEVKGMNDTVRAGLTSWQDMVRQMGFDPETVLKEIAEDNARFDALGLMLTSDARYDPNRKPDDPTDPNEPDEPTPAQAKAAKPKPKAKK